MTSPKRQGRYTRECVAFDLAGAMAENLLTLHDVAEHFRVDSKTVQRLRAEDPDFPRPIVIRRAERWLRADIEEWERLQKAISRAGQLRTILDNAGQSGTTAKRADLPARRRRRRK